METLQCFEIPNPKGVVLVIHGSGEHIGRYLHVAEWLNKQNLIMVGGDLPGLGKSRTKRGHIEEFKDYLNKVEEWHQFVTNKWPDLPVFLFGHSMGGLIVLRYLEEFEVLEKQKHLQLAGIIVTSPAISIAVEVPKWQLILAKILHSFWPTFRMKSNIQPHQITRDPVIIKNTMEDPLVYYKVSIRWFFEMKSEIEKVWKRKEQINHMNIPLLYLQAGADVLVSPEKAVLFVQKLNPKLIEFILVPNLYHEILNEPEKEEYLEKMTQWIEKITFS